MFEYRLKFHWNVLLMVQLTISQHWFRSWLGADQATSHYLNQWWLDYRRISASLGLNELSKCLLKSQIKVINCCGRRVRGIMNKKAIQWCIGYPALALIRFSSALKRNRKFVSIRSALYHRKMRHFVGSPIASLIAVWARDYMVIWYTPFVSSLKYIAWPTNISPAHWQIGNSELPSIGH